MMNLEQRLRVPHPSNPLIIRNYRVGFYVTFAQSPQLTPYIGMALTLISMIYPSQYGWNQPAESRTSPTILMSLMPASGSISNTEICYYEQFRNGIILRKGDDYHVYHDKSYIPMRNQKSPGSLIDYLFGWTTAIEEFCQSTSHHPNCTNPISRSFIKREFVTWTINNPDHFKSLDDYINTIYNKSIGRDLQWLYSSIAPIKDNIRNRLEISDLYAQVDKQQGQIFHTKKGL